VTNRDRTPDGAKSAFSHLVNDCGLWLDMVSLWVMKQNITFILALGCRLLWVLAVGFVVP